MAVARKECRYDNHGRIVLVARGSGYVMVRRPGCLPFVKTEKQWAKMDAEPWAEDRLQRHKAAAAKRQAESVAIVRFLMRGGRTP